MTMIRSEQIVGCCRGPFAPEASAIVVAARDEVRGRGRVDNAFDDAVVAEAEQLLTLGVARIPAAQRGGLLVRVEDVVLGVIEDGLGALLLLAGRAGAGVGDEAASGGQLPQADDRVLAAAQQVLGVARERHRAHLLLRVRVRERVDALVAHRVPDLDTSVLACSNDQTLLETHF